MVFPLPVTPFEYYYWCDDRPEYPTTFPIELTFRGELAADLVQQAVGVAAERHPMLQARVDDGRRPPMWEAAPARPEVKWSQGLAPPGQWRARTLDLRREIGVRIEGSSDGSTTRLLLEFHHCCCDAIGALQFVEDVLVAYDALASGARPDERLESLNPARLPMRADYGLSEANYKPNLRDAWITARLWTEWIARQPARVVAGGNGQPGRPVEDHGFLTHVVPSEQLHQIRSVATRCEATVNDILLRDMFLALQSWARQQGERPKRWLRINVPTNLRGRTDRDLPAANVLAFAFLSRRIRDCGDPAELLRGIRDETQLMRRYRTGLFFIGGLDIGRRIPGLLPWMLRRDRSFATVCLSNVGRVLARTPLARRAGELVCGKATLAQVCGVPPIRCGTQASLAVVTYGRHTTINLRCDPRYFDRAMRQQFLDAYTHQLQETARRQR